MTQHSVTPNNVQYVVLSRLPSTLEGCKHSDTCRQVMKQLQLLPRLVFVSRVVGELAGPGRAPQAPISWSLSPAPLCLVVCRCSFEEKKIYTKHLTLKTKHVRTLNTLHCTLHTLHCTLHTATAYQWTMNTTLYTVKTSHYTLQTEYRGNTGDQ